MTKEAVDSLKQKKKEEEEDQKKKRNLKLLRKCSEVENCSN